MTIYKGKGVCDAAAAGSVYILKHKETKISADKISDAAAEMQRFEKAKSQAALQLENIYKKASAEAGKETAAVFEIHLMMLEDEDYNDSIAGMITAENYSAEYAVSVTGDNFAKLFEETDDPYMQARAADVHDISNRILNLLTGIETESKFPDEPVIIFADDLAPSETVTFDKSRVLAFATAYGSLSSHTAILARSMNIPAIIGLGKDFLSEAKDGDFAAVNGFSGELILNPDEKTVDALKNRQIEENKKVQLREQLKGRESITADGRRINIFANIGSADDVKDVLINDGEGIGLFRSEFIFLESKDFPTEEKQLEIYSSVLKAMGDKKVIIRTLDIGADKQCSYFKLDKEENPALGIRGARLCLNRPDIFYTQLRALYRASVYGNLGIMFPMIANEWELDKIMEICRSVMDGLKAEGVPYNEKTELGIMIETPAAALISGRLAEKADFFSIGTNDLTQYTLACDRQNPRIDPYCDTHHEAVLKLIEMTAENAHKHGKWVGICGELASDTSLTERFIDMGIDELSVSPSLVLKLRERVRGIKEST